MRVIAGALKGRQLVTPKGATTRPTADQVRIALMDTPGPWLPDASVLDLFAGAHDVGERTLAALAGGALIAAEGLVIAQHLTKRQLPEYGVLRAFRDRRFGE